MDTRATIDNAHSEIKKLDRELDRLVELILKGGAAKRINETMVGMERRKKELEQFIADSIQPPPLLHPQIASFYRKQVSHLYEAFQGHSDTHQLNAAEALRSLVSEIIITPQDGQLSIDMSGDLAGILNLSQNAKKPAVKTGLSQAKLVCGLQDLNLAAFRLWFLLQRGASDDQWRRSLYASLNWYDFGSLVAGAGFEPAAFRL